MTNREYTRLPCRLGKDLLAADGKGMNDCFVADVGDFGKYGLLRALCAPNPPNGQPALSLGVVWYRTPSQGNAPCIGNTFKVTRQYLIPSPHNVDRFAACDPGLYAILQNINKGVLSLEAVRKEAILPQGTVFVEDIVTAPRRATYLGIAFTAVSPCNVVFLDPDNGIMDASVNLSNRSVEHCYLDEIQQLVRLGKSLVVYHHFDHTDRNNTLRKWLDNLRELDKGRSPFALSWHRVQARDFLVLPSPQHDALLRQRAKTMLQGPWGRKCKGLLSPNFSAVDL